MADETEKKKAEIFELLRPKGPDEVAAAFVARHTFGALMKRKLPAEEQLLGSLVTRTTRMWLVGSTGAGKTMLGLAIAGGMATGTGFLNWRSSRKARVLYIDGEMPVEMLQARGRDLARRLGQDGEEVPELVLFSTMYAEDEEPVLGPFEPLNNAAGQEWVLRLCDLVKPDVVIFDNLQSLISGVLKEEQPWIDTKPLVSVLTKRRIGQIWVDHTGHDQSKQYGTKTKSWQFDTVGIMNPVSRAECAPGELRFTLSFDDPDGKARNRSPANWTDYAAQTISLLDDEWTTTASRPRKANSLGKNDELALRGFSLAWHDDAVATSAVIDGLERRVVTERAWRERFYRECMPQAEQDTRKHAFNRGMKNLLLAERIGMQDGFCWIGTSKP